jgi:hypothetical protein
VFINSYNPESFNSSGFFFVFTLLLGQDINQLIPPNAPPQFGVEQEEKKVEILVLNFGSE